MCGIAGYIGKNFQIDHDKFEKMVDMVVYRGPNDRGTYYHDTIALGQRRLSIIDVSSDGHQPFLYKNRYILVYNGEIYNYIELRAELIEKGYVFNTKTDTEVLAAMYDCYGSSCVELFNGMWAFAIFDKESNTIFCSRDRFGVKPLYYYSDDDQFVFASEIKQILSVWGQKAVVSKKKMLEFLMQSDLDFSEETLFKNIRQLMPGCNLEYLNGQHTYKVARYYDLKTSVAGKIKSVGNYREECEKFRRNFESAVRLRLRSDVPVGFCLSGGLDSSAIVSMVDHIDKNNTKEPDATLGLLRHTITSCSSDPRYDEQEYADEVIRETGAISHKIFPESDNLFDELDEIIWHMDEPFGSTSIYASWDVFEEARKQNLTVMLDGQGADEQLAGYSNFYSVFFVDLIKHFKFITFIREIKAYKQFRSITEKQIDVKNIVMYPLIAAFLPKWMYQIIRINANRKNQKMPFSYEDYKLVLKNRSIYSFRDARQFVYDHMQNGLCALLHYEERNSMAFSIETRLPFLDYRLVEQICAMPISYKIRDGRTKAIMRDALLGIMPEKIRTRNSKFGFVTPEDQWINDNYELYHDELESACKKLKGIIDEQLVMSWFEERKGKMKRGDSLAWRIICAGHWMDVFNVQAE